MKLLQSLTSTLKKNYKIKEIYYTLQGEGYYSGRPAVFCRFTGCNLWTGREEDRASAICQFCDTDFYGMDGERGGKYTAEELAETCKSLWKKQERTPFVVFTGGEPALQLDEELISIFKEKGFYTAVETNGTLPLPSNIDWVTCSPKARTEIILEKSSELKIVLPQEGVDPRDFVNFKAEHFYIQPMDNALKEENTKYCEEYCRANPRWKLSLQLHKILGIK